MSDSYLANLFRGSTPVLNSVTAASSSSSSSSSSEQEQPIDFDTEVIDTVSFVAQEGYRRFSEKRISNVSDDKEHRLPLADRIDKIDPNIVGQADYKEVYFSSPSCCQRGVKFIFNSDNALCEQLPFEASWKTVLEKQKKRGVPSEGMRKMEAQAARLLSQDSHGSLFERIKISVIDSKNQMKKKIISGGGDEFEQEKKLAFANLFFVTKHNDEDKLRVILDGRYANCMMRNYDYHFELFSLEDLISGISAMSKYTKWYAVETDIRHYFHQIPAPEQLRKLFILKDTVTSGDHCCYEMKAFPMGYVLSPFVAQSLTWGMLLQSAGVQFAGETNKSPKMRANGDKWNMDKEQAQLLGIEVDYVNNLKGLPRFLPLTCGGAIFVILDNVLVITPLKARAEAWEKRVAQVTKEANVVLKEVNSTTIRLHEMEKGNGVSFEFLGVDWKHNSRRVRVSPNEKIPGLNMKNGEWAGTHRDLASVLGKLLWFHRVREADMFRNDLQGFRRLYKYVTPSSQREWDKPISLTVEQIQVIREQWDLREVMSHPEQENAWVLNKEQLKEEGEVALCAVDASSKVQLIGSSLFFPNSNWNCIMTQVLHQYDSNTKIALAELEAILFAVRWIPEIYKQLKLNEVGTFIIATDNQNALHWIEKRVADREQANEILEELFDELKNRKLKLVYIESGKNLADIPSRKLVVGNPKKGLTAEESRTLSTTGRASKKTVIAFTQQMLDEEDATDRYHNTKSVLEQKFSEHKMVEKTRGVRRERRGEKDEQKDEMQN